MSSEYKRVRDYELMVVFHPELSEEDLIAVVAKVEGHITGVDGTIRLINREMPWGRRRLAYPIRHDSRDVRDGVYVLYYFTTETNRIEDIEREIKLEDRVLRYLLTQQSAPMMEPTPVEEEGAEQAEASAPAEAGTPVVAEAASVETPVAAVDAVAEEVVPEAETPVVDEVAPEAEAAVAEEPAVIEKTAESADAVAVESK